MGKASSSPNEEETAQLEKNWSAIFDAIPDCISLHDKNYRFVKVNKALADLLGKPQEELIGKYCYKLIHGTDEPVADCPHKKTLTTKTPSSAYLTEPSLGCHLLVHTAPISNDNGDIIGTIHTAKDVSELKKSQEELKTSEEKFRNIFDNANIMIWGTHADGRIKIFNKEAERVTGYSKEEILGKENLLLHPPEERDEIIEKFKRHREGELHNDLELGIYTKDGRRLQGLLAQATFKDSNGQDFYVALTQNITERKKAEEKIKKYSYFQSVMNKMLSISLKRYTLETMLKHILQEIVSINWLTPDKKGAIFLTPGSSDEVVMQAHKNFPSELLSICKKVPFGQCMCGLAASTQKIQFANHLDKRHENCYAGIPDHGHYCVPIISSGKTLGILNLYVSPGHVHTKEEEKFLLAIANGLAGIIERKRAQINLDKYSQQLESMVKKRTHELTKANDQLVDEIDDRIEIAQQLQHEKALAQQYLDVAGVMMVVLDRQFNVTLINKKGCEILGYKSKDIIGKNWINNFIPKKQRKKVRAVAVKLIKERIDSHEYYENPILTKKGEEKLIAWHNSVIRDARGKTTHTLSSGEDITIRKQAEENLRNSEVRFRTLFEQAAESIVIIDPKNKKIVDFNEHSYQNLGYTAKEFQKLSMSDIQITDPPEDIKQRAQELKKIGYCTFETRHRAKNGEIKYRVVNSKKINLAGKEYIQSLWTDITKRKQVENKLREFQFISNYSNDAHFLLGRDAKFRYVNERACAVLGYSAKELLHLGVPDVDILYDTAKYQELFDLIQKQSLPPIESINKRKDGSTFPSELTVTGYQIEGKPYMFAALRDISERKQAEKTLRESENKYRKLIETANDAIFLADTETGKIIEVNKRAENLLGRPSSEIIGMHQAQLHPKEKEQEYRKMFQKGIRSDQYSPTITTFVVHKDGHQIPVEISSSTTLIKNKKIIQGVFRDITERKQAETTIQQHLQETSALNRISQKTSASLSLNRVVRATIQEVVKTIHPDMVFVFLIRDNKLSCYGKHTANKKFIKDKKLMYDLGECLCGLAASEKKAVYSTNIHQDPRCTRNECKEAGAHSLCTLPLQSQNKVIGVLALASFQERDFKEQSIFLETVANTISTNLQNALLYQEINKHRLELQKLVEIEVAKSRQKDIALINQSRLAAMGEMIGIIAHQWRQPLSTLNIILANIKDLCAYQGLDEQELEPLTAKGHELINMMSNTIDDFRDFFKPRKTKELFSVNKSVKQSLALVEANLRYHNIKTTIHEQDKVSTVGFPNEYSQALLNILENAKDAIMENNVSGEIIIEIYSQEDSAIVSVQDNAGGIPKEILKNLFNPYVSTKKHNGTGLGLSLSKQIIEDHMNGDIKIHNSKKGAKFEIITPSFS